MSIQKVKVRGQRSRQSSRMDFMLRLLTWFRKDCKVTEVKTQLSRFRTVTQVWIHIWWWNDKQSLMLLKPRSHIACNRSATSLRPKFREVAGRLQGGRRPVVEGCRDNLVARRFWLLQMKPLSATISIVERFLMVADSLATDSRPVAVVEDNPDTVFSRRSVAYRSPKGCRFSAIINKRSRYSRRPITNPLPNAS